MRGEDRGSGRLFSYVDLESRVPADHPLRAIRGVMNEALAGLSAEFAALYSHTGRPSIPPERLLRALLLQAFYSIRSERRLMEELEFNLLYRWFVGLGIDDPVWDATVFCKNRDRLLAGEVATRFLASLLALPEVKRLLSDEHFSVDGTLIEAWASIMSFRARDGEDDGGAPSDSGGRNQERDFHGTTWSNETHRSTTDGDARLYRKGRNKEAKLCYLGHALMENRHGLAVDGLVSRTTGEAERLAAEVMLMRRPERRRRITLGADKAHDAADFVATCQSFRVTPHVARNTTGRRSNITDAVAESDGYAASQKARKRIEEVFAWVKTIAGQDKARHRGLVRVDWQFTLALAAYNLIRIPKLIAEAPT
jgi:transposase